METKWIHDSDTTQFEPAIIHRWDRFGVRSWMAAAMTSCLDVITVSFLLVGGCLLKILMKPRMCESFHSFMHRWEPAFCFALFQLHTSFYLRRFHKDRSWLGAWGSISQPCQLLAMAFVSASTFRWAQSRHLDVFSIFLLLQCED